jgi:hypothetical protein
LFFLATVALVVASVVWTILELSLRTFRAGPGRKTFVIGFAFVGAAVAACLAAVPLIVNRGVAYGGQVPLIGLPLCPSSLAFIVFLDVRHPPLSFLEQMAMFTALVNAAFYAAIGGRVREFMRRKRVGP